MNEKQIKIWIFFGIFFMSWVIFSNLNNYEYSGVDEEIKDDFSNIKEMHWNHMPITYEITNKMTCGKYEQGMILRGFNEIESVTEGIVWFEEVNDSADIEITCSFIKDCYERHIDIRTYFTIEYESICGHDSGNAQIIEYQENIISKAKIGLIGLHGFAETSNRGMSGFSIGDCGYPHTEIHEILHTFNFGHSIDPYNIMHPFAESVGYTIHIKGECQNAIKSIDESIISCLKYIYSNGEVEGNCSGVNFLGEEDILQGEHGGCLDNWYIVHNTNYCCPEPNMIINEEGYCSRS